MKKVVSLHSIGVTGVTGITLLAVASLLTMGACQATPTSQKSQQTDVEDEMAADRPDPHSFSRPDEVRVRHLDLDLTVDFDAQRLRGVATLDLERVADSQTLRLDTRQLEIQSIQLDDGSSAPFQLGEEQPFLGRELTVTLKPETAAVTIQYETHPQAAALQWLEPRQTTDGKHPFLFSQSQAILARSWVPCQDSPAVRMTYTATVRVPAELLALMSAENPTEKSPDGVYEFNMPQPIPSYLLALAVGDLAFRPLGERTGVYSEPSVSDAAAHEFVDVEAMVEATERLYGSYRWGRYDILVLPASFPFGGMENPRLTFATPTILAGDRSLVALVAHELAHSWSGNLVTNATWDDFWLNEGFTTYLERRIMEDLYGRDYEEMLASLGLQDLRSAVEDLGAESPDTHLHLSLAGRDPDDGMTNIAYEKGAHLLRLLEETVGRQRWDEFLLAYFEEHAFRSLSTEQFVGYLREHLLAEDPTFEAAVDLKAWIYGPGLPDNVPVAVSAAFDQVEGELNRWRGGTAAAQLDTAGWSTHQWLHLLRKLPVDLADAQLTDLDEAFGLTQSGNSEILSAWLKIGVQHNYPPIYPALEHFLQNVGRRKFLSPLYTALAATPEGLDRARELYGVARPGYHSVATGTIDGILSWEDSD